MDVCKRNDRSFPFHNFFEMKKWREWSRSCSWRIIVLLCVDWEQGLKGSAFSIDRVACVKLVCNTILAKIIVTAMIFMRLIYSSIKWCHRYRLQLDWSTRPEYLQTEVDITCISHDRTVYLPYEYLGCNDFLARVVAYEWCLMITLFLSRTFNWCPCF